MFTIADLAALSDLEKLLIAEIECKRALEEETWTQGGTYTNTYWMILDKDEDVHRVLLDGVEIDEKKSVAVANTNPGSYYYNQITKMIHIHTTDSDSPATLSGDDPKYSVIVYFNLFFSNRPYTIEPATQRLLNPGLEWWASASDCEDWTEDVAGSSTVAREGTEVYGTKSAYAAKLTADGSNSKTAFKYEGVILTPGMKARVRFRYKFSTAAKTGLVYIFDSASNVFLDPGGGWSSTPVYFTLANTLTWALFDEEFEVHGSYSSYNLTVRELDLISASLYVDDFEFWSYRLPRPCMEYITADGLPSIIQSVGDYHDPVEQFQMGVLKLKNTGTLTQKRSVWLWENCEARFWIARLTDEYVDFTPFGFGALQDPGYEGNEMVFEIADPRTELKGLPNDDETFNSTDYPNCEDAWKDKPIPVLLGDGHRIVPPCCDTSAQKFKLSRVTFNGSTINMFAVGDVYDGDTLKTLTTHYTVDLTTGIIDYIGTPTGILNVECSGLEIDFDSAGSYTAHIHDFIYFLYVTVNQISKDRIDRKTLLDLEANRVIPMGGYFKERTDLDEIMRILKLTNIFQSYIGLDGKYYFPYAAEEVPDDAPHFYYPGDVMGEPSLKSDTDQCYRRVTVESDWWEYLEYFENIETKEDTHTKPKYGVSKEKLITGCLAVLGVDVQSLRDNYLSMLKVPPNILTVELRRGATLLNPTDKFYFTWPQTDDNGDTSYVCDEEVFRILSIEKDGNGDTARIRAIKDVADFWFLMT